MHIRADGLDTVKIGMPWPEAVSLANLVVQRDTKECSLASDPASGASITAYDQVVTLIMVQDSGVETVAGIGVGDSEDEVFAVYPLDALDTEKGRLVILDGSNELVVGLFGGKVTYLWARQGGIANHC